MIRSAKTVSLKSLTTGTGTPRLGSSGLRLPAADCSGSQRSRTGLMWRELATEALGSRACWAASLSEGSWWSTLSARPCIVLVD